MDLDTFSERLEQRIIHFLHYDITKLEFYELTYLDARSLELSAKMSVLIYKEEVANDA